MKKLFRNLPLHKKISSVYIVANILILLVNIALLLSVNNMSAKIEMVYRDNLNLAELSKSLDSVQSSMTDYLSYRTSDSLEDYYRNTQQYSKLIDGLNEDITGMSFGRMERNIKNMSEVYLNIVSQTVEAKRGRNVEKYRIRYESATKQYQYIEAYIEKLNQERFEYNTKEYTELSKNFELFESASLVILGVVMIGNIIIITSFTSSIISPLKNLAVSADEIAKGNFDVEIKTVNSNDEIGVVSKAFNKMVVSIREYICQIQQRMEVERALKEKELMMEAHLKDAQLKYLQAQINPHFLFNTLNAGAQLAMMEGADRTYNYVQNVADFFRYNMKKSNEIVTIGEEIELVDNYIYILNVRFSGEIHYDKQVDTSLLEVQMPGMILQPIVENCVNHGIREMAGKGTIKLSVYHLDDVTCISIKDNGKGMSPEMIEKVLTGKAIGGELSRDSNGIGMDNVINRIRLYTGEDELISIVSDGKDKGTEVLIYLPDNRREEEDV